jgi:hypothetical protein
MIVSRERVKYILLKWFSVRYDEKREDSHTKAKETFGITHLLNLSSQVLLNFFKSL